ncbi:Leucine-rich repeat-containing protein 4 [Holothuria leucospilota]|uniref:Leucine-rich repeat-containing protein 4 n=1 Tax=Holothuria leucospilota TaxID=206669 RepID=A0A9Q1HM67_HOLLE|nr:Leucine-rich repeat-containing protein 4 [Holothuria leucospilota]
MMAKPTMILLLLSAFFILTSEACPPSCECNKNEDLEKVNCTGRGLSAIPGDIPASTTDLYLQQNKISSLSPEDFVNLVNLTNLWLDENSISKIDDNTFQNNSNLLLLSLNKNKLIELTNGTFTGATQLVTLKLEDNPDLLVKKGTFQQIKSLKHLYLSNTSFSNTDNFGGMENLNELVMDNNHVKDVSFLSSLSMLKNVHISSNNISKIPLGTFDSNKQLQKIYMDSNNIEKLEPGLFSTLKNLSYIALENNSIQSFTRDIFNEVTNLSSPEFHFNVSKNLINCDCNMKWLASTKIEGQCFQPNFVKDFDFSNMSLTDYQCGPTSNYSKDWYTVSEGGNITVYCPILIDPLESIFWETPVKTISGSLPLTDQSGDIYILGTGDLKVQNAKMEHRGVYHCTFGNRAGELRKGPFFLDVDEESTGSGATILALSISLSVVTIVLLFLLFFRFYKRFRVPAEHRYQFLQENPDDGATANISE